MKTVNSSIYDPSPIFLARHPSFVNAINTRVFFMKGFLDMLLPEEQLAAVKREMVETICDNVSNRLTSCKKVRILKHTKKRA